MKIPLIMLLVMSYFTIVGVASVFRSLLPKSASALKNTFFRIFYNFFATLALDSEKVEGEIKTIATEAYDDLKKEINEVTTYVSDTRDKLIVEEQSLDNKITAILNKIDQLNTPSNSNTTTPAN